MTENALPRASESFAEGNGSISTVVADLQRLVPGWNVVQNGPLGSLRVRITNRTMTII